MLKNEYNIFTNDFKCNKNTMVINPQLQINVYHSLNELIDYYKHFYDNTKNIKSKQNKINDFTFNEYYHDFISWFLYVLKIGKNDFCTIIQYDDYIVIYTKNDYFEYVFD